MNQTYLLVFSIGPVQDFIAAARRTRDLWFGSHLLSELARTSARTLLADGALLIFPAPESKDGLAENSDLPVANVVLVEIPSENRHSPLQLADQCRKAVQAHWLNFAEEACSEAQRRSRGSVTDSIWQEQARDVIETFAAWVPLASADAYPSARKRLMNLLAARKSTRDFQAANGHWNVPKSSLDGARESVLARDLSPPERFRLGLTEGEQLDVVGLTKRLAVGRQSYPSVARVAADPWLREAATKHAESLGRLCDAAKLLVPTLISGVPESDSRHPNYSCFPFDGTILFSNRHARIAKDAGLSPEQGDTQLRPLRAVLKELVVASGQPSPYLAVLAADGDQIGKTLNALQTTDAHRKFSQKLAQFAQDAGQTVKKYHGVAIYTGGDDVLALLPVDNALKAARELREKFIKTVVQSAPSSEKPTLSVGVAVGHFMEPLEDLRAFAIAAEQHAKRPRQGDPDSTDRNGIAIHVHPRSGTDFSIRECWREGSDSLDHRLKQWAGFFDQAKLPKGLPYEIRTLANTFEGWSDAEILALALPAELRRILGRKETQLNEGEKAWIEKQFDSVKERQALKALARELLVARWLAPHQTGD
jgi:CRISPR-associated protein Cmr2